MSLPTVQQNQLVKDLSRPSVDAGSRQRKQLFRLALVMCPTLAAVVVLASAGIAQVRKDSAAAHLLNQNVRVAETLRALLATLRTERGLTCIKLSQDTPTAKSVSTLEVARTNTDLALADVQNDKNKIEAKVTRIREWADQKHFSPVCLVAIDHYTNLTNDLMLRLSFEFHSSTEGKFWNYVRHFSGVISANDLIGINRAMGGSFFAAGDATRKLWTKYSEHSGTADWLLEYAKKSIEEIDKLYLQLTFDHPKLMSQLTEMERMFLDNNFTGEDVSQAHIWFENMTQYISIIGKLENSISDELHFELSARTADSDWRFWVQICVLAMICTVCPILAVVYVIQTEKLMNKCNDFADQVVRKSEEMARQRQHTDLFLNRILPIAQRLSSKCNCEQRDGQDIMSQLRTEILKEIWSLQKDGPEAKDTKM